MTASAMAALAAIGRANLALSRNWIEFSIRSFALGHEALQMGFEAFLERPVAATQVAMAQAAAAATRDVTPPESDRGGVDGAGVYGPLAQGLSCLVADYAHDMAPTYARGA